MMTKKEQLRVAFKRVMQLCYVERFGLIDEDEKLFINDVAALLLKEVSIRTELK